jgi:PKD repeat protein
LLIRFRFKLLLGLGLLAGATAFALFSKQPPLPQSRAVSILPTVRVKTTSHLAAPRQNTGFLRITPSNDGQSFAPILDLKERDPHSRFQNPAKPVCPIFPKQFTEPVRVRCGIADVSCRPIGASPESVGTIADNGDLVYSNAFTGCDVSYRCMPLKTEEFITVKDASALTRWTWELDTHGLTPRLTAASTIELLDASGVPRLRINAPDGKDAEGKLLSAGKELKLELYGNRVALSTDLRGCELPVVIDPSWSSTGSIAIGRENHTATLISNGNVLIAGGWQGSSHVAACELYDFSTGVWTSGGTLATARQDHTMTLLPNGKVLVAGGRTGFTATSSTVSCELYDPATNSWGSAASLATARCTHTAVLLGNGKVLVSGGSNGSALASCELYDPANDSWSPAGTLNFARFLHASLLTSNGNVVAIAGGNGGSPVSSCEIYDPGSDSWIPLGSLIQGRYYHRASLLNDGTVLVTGGDNGSYLASCEIYDPSNGTTFTTASLSTARRLHRATVLGDGEVLVTGGSNGTPLASCEIYDPHTKTWRGMPSLAQIRYYHTVMFYNNVVLVAGGYSGSFYISSSEILTLAPTAVSSTVQTHFGVAKSITLSSDSIAASYSMSTLPAHGSLSGTPPNLIYSPMPSFVGTDHFSYTATDSLGTGPAATVTINVTDTAPVVTNLSLPVHTGFALPVVLPATDGDSDMLTFSIVTPPAHGTLSGTLPNVTYTSGAYAGPDSFTFNANDGALDSNVALVSINVTDTAPVANAQNVNTHFNTGVVINIVATDADADPLTYTRTAPTHGTLTGVAPSFQYTPDAGYAGADSFTINANDGTLDSNVALVSINVTDTAPVANAQIVSTHLNMGVVINIVATDADADALTYTRTAPTHGTLTGVAPNFQYTPDAGYAGADSFTFNANDGLLDSNLAIININITDTDPISTPQNLSIHSGVAKAIILAATDADNDPLTYSIVAQPAHGTLTGTPPNVTYISAAFAGPDRFSFKTNDSMADSNVAVVSITVTDEPPQVSLLASPTILIEGQSAHFDSGATDPDGDPLTFSWDFGDSGTSTGANPTHFYATAGVYTATVTVTDISGATVTQSITINVFHDSDRPTARFTSSALNGFVGQPLGFDATFSTDPLNNIVSYDWDFGDGSPHGSGQAISRTYTAEGTYTVTLTITDARGLTDTTALTMVVLPAAQAGLLNPNIKYSVNWNRSATNADALNLNATVNVGNIPVSSTSPLSLNIVGQTFTGTSATKLVLPRAVKSGPEVKWKVKAVTKKGTPKGTYALTCSIKHASLGLAFALAGATGTKTGAAKIPVRLGVGGSSFASGIQSSFKFGSNGKASGGGEASK